MKVKKFLTAMLAGTMVMASAVAVSAETLTGSGWWNADNQTGAHQTITGDGEWTYTIKVGTNDDGTLDGGAFCIEVNDSNRHYITTTSANDGWIVDANNYNAVKGSSISGITAGGNGYEVGVSADGSAVDTYTVTVTRFGDDWTFHYYEGTDTEICNIHATMPAEGDCDLHFFAQIGTYDVTVFSDGYQSEDTVSNSGICGKNLTWTLDSDGTLIISGTGAMENYKDYGCAPWHPYLIRKVILEDGVTTIGDFAFESCSLDTVTIPESVTGIGRYAFAMCENLNEVQIPNGVNQIGEAAFYLCSSLTRVTIPESVTTIGDCAFSDCYKLMSLTIPASVESIGYAAFGYDWLEESDTNSLAIFGYTIYGYTGTAAQAYADQYGVAFVALDADTASSPKADDMTILSDATNDTYVYGFGKGITIHCSGELKDFIRVFVDGEVVNEENYTLEEGSTILTFKSEYLDTLKPGEHTVTLEYTTGNISTTMTLMESAAGIVAKSPQTGDAATAVLWITLLLGASILSGAAILARRREAK